MGSNENNIIPVGLAMDTVEFESIEYQTCGMCYDETFGLELSFDNVG